MDDMTLVSAVRECCWNELVTYGARVPEVLLAKDMKNWMSHMLDTVSATKQNSSISELLQNVCQDQVPPRPDMNRSLDGLYAAFGCDIDFVQLLVRIIRVLFLGCYVSSRQDL